MFRWVLLFLGFTAFAQTQEEIQIPDRPIVPYGFNLHQGKKLIVFVDEKCSTCLQIQKNLTGTDFTFIGKKKLPVPFSSKQVVDKSGLLHTIFAAQKLPMFVLVQDGITVQPFFNSVRTEDIQKVKVDTTLPANQLKVRLGEKLSGDLQKHTGAIVFWRSSCSSCQREKPVLIRMCAKKTNPLVVYSTRQESELLPKGCKGNFGRDLALSLGVPAVPTVLYLKNGRLIWYNVGYFGNLERVIEIFSEMK